MPFLVRWRRRLPAIIFFHCALFVHSENTLILIVIAGVDARGQEFQGGVSALRLSEMQICFLRVLNTGLLCPAYLYLDSTNPQSFDYVTIHA